SVALAHPALLWLGDIIPWPGPLPNVLSVGDCLVYAGTLVLLHRACARPPGPSVPAAAVPAPGVSKGLPTLHHPITCFLRSPNLRAT
ncbi:MAG: DUF5317 domain-containing protein, partial [Actinomycetota bacterium]|nr:DUF5317 domain-containing protein [Actinomycetota bacterium]